MKETNPTAIGPCFNRWCERFGDVFKAKAQKSAFKCYLGGLLGESEGKNLSQIPNNSVGTSYHSLRHFLVRSNWEAEGTNNCRRQIMNQCSQTRIQNNFTLIIDDSGLPKSGNFTDGVGRQYIGEIGKTDSGIVIVTTHLFDGVKSLPLDIALYQQATSLPEGKKRQRFY